MNLNAIFRWVQPLALMLPVHRAGASLFALFISWGLTVGAQAQTLEQAREAMVRLDWVASGRMIDAALTEHPKHLEWLLLKGVWLSESGNPQQAEAFLTPLADAFPEWGPLHNNLALAQAKQGRYDAAYSTLQRGLIARPKDAIMLENLKRLESLRAQ